MVDGSPAEPKQNQRSPGKKVKKTYTKPAFRFEQVFETQALSCGKIHGHGNICNINRKTS
jgi:hypothetical protein